MNGIMIFIGYVSLHAYFSMNHSVSFRGVFFIIACFLDVAAYALILRGYIFQGVITIAVSSLGLFLADVWLVYVHYNSLLWFFLISVLNWFDFVLFFIVYRASNRLTGPC